MKTPIDEKKMIARLGLTAEMAREWRKDNRKALGYDADTPCKIDSSSEVDAANDDADAARKAMETEFVRKARREGVDDEQIVAMVKRMRRSFGIEGKELDEIDLDEIEAGAGDDDDDADADQSDSDDGDAPVCDAEEDEDDEGAPGDDDGGAALAFERELRKATMSIGGNPNTREARRSRVRSHLLAGTCDRETAFGVVTLSFEALK